MLRIERQNKHFVRLEEPTCAAASITERYDLEEFIFNSPDEFFAEINQQLFVLGKEVKPSQDVQDRIDILALDPEGTAVIIELKRGNNRLQLLQAIAYAGMIAKWKQEDFFRLLNAERMEKLSDFIEPEWINREQRVLLVAESYDYEVLAGAEWLHDKYEVDILCCRISLATDAKSGAEYLSCTQVFPAPEAAVPRHRAAGQAAQFTSWDMVLTNVSNPAVKDYFAAQLKDGRENNLGSNARLHYRLPQNGRRRWRLLARKESAFCVQNGRFEDDVDFWRERISDPDSVATVKVGLRFSLLTADDFLAFHKAATDVLSNVRWIDSEEDDDVGQEQGLTSSVETVVP